MLLPVPSLIGIAFLWVVMVSLGWVVFMWHYMSECHEDFVFGSLSILVDVDGPHGINSLLLRDLPVLPCECKHLVEEVG